MTETARVRELKPVANPDDRFRLVRFAEIKLDTRQRSLVKGIIPANALVIVWGEPKCGKSFWAFDVALHIALEWPYRGRRVRQGDVVYCALEGAAGYSKRIAAMKRHYGIEDTADVPLYLMPTALDLVADHAALIAAIKTQTGGRAPACIFIDTLNRSLHGSESSDEDTAAYVRAADALRAAFECAIVIVHHCGYNDSRMRGHSSLIGALDVEISVKKGADRLFTVKIERAKDDAEGDTFTSRLEVVDLGMDDEGDTISSCVVQPADDDGIARKATTRKLSDRQKNAVTSLQGLVGTTGAPVPAGFDLPASIMGVQVSAWRDDLLRRGTLDKDAKNPRSDFQRLREALQARHVIGERDGWVWLV